MSVSSFQSGTDLFRVLTHITGGSVLHKVLGARLLQLSLELLITENDVNSLLHALTLPQPALLHLLRRLTLLAQARCPGRNQPCAFACEQHQCEKALTHLC